jgi:hypothetical protein
MTRANRAPTLLLAVLTASALGAGGVLDQPLARAVRMPELAAANQTSAPLQAPAGLAASHPSPRQASEPAEAPAAAAAPATSQSPLAAAAPSGSAPAGAPTPDACPPEMALVHGLHCLAVEQVCLRWDDPDGQPQKRVCGKFQQPSTCLSRRQPMRFCIDRSEYIPQGESLPAKGMSWRQAELVCTSSGKRLCTETEWEFACEGEEGLPYPYGYERSPALCNQDRLLRDGKQHASADLREPPHATCASPFGVLDLVGNVDEWVKRPYGTPPHRSELRGGWWMTGRNRCRALTGHHDEKYAGPQTGFRCCRDTADQVAARQTGPGPGEPVAARIAASNAERAR